MQEQPDNPLSQSLGALRRRRWSILAFVSASVLATLVVSLRIPPAFESTATISIDRRSPLGVLGQKAMQSAATDSEQFLATQMKLVQSDTVLRPVAQRYKLADAEDAPVLLKRLKVSRTPNTCLLLISYRSPDARLAADAANAIAQSYLEQTYNLQYRSSAGLSAFMEKQLEELKAKIERSSPALAQFEREPDAVNPEGKAGLLAARLGQLKSEYASAQRDRARKEAAKTAPQPAGAESRPGTERPDSAPRIETEYRLAVARAATLQNAVAETQKELDRLWARSSEYQALKREAEGDRKLYEELTRNTKEAGVDAGFQNSSIRIADPARPARQPVFPDLKLNLLLAFAISILLAIGAAMLSGAFDNTVRDPEQAARTLKAEVIGTLPVVKPWRGKLALVAANGNGTGSLALAPEKGDRALAAYEEAIRTLRNSILLLDFDRGLRSLLVTSAVAGEGKSTVAAHLAVAHAQQGHRTLLIDADLRRPSIHRRFGVPGALGLAGTLEAGSSWRDAVIKLGQLPELEILPAGPSSRRATDFIGRGLAKILDEAAASYDMVILDSPPLLGFAEPLQLATIADGVIVVTLAGRTNRKAVSAALGTLRRLRANLVGVVLNELASQTGGSYSYYGAAKERAGKTVR